jgi:transposase-like protein
MMQSDPICVLFVGVVLMLLVVISSRRCDGAKATPVATKPPRPKRAPKPFAGFIHKPECPLCEPEAERQHVASAPNAPPPRMLFIRGRRRHVDTTGHFCPQDTCSYHGRVDFGNIRANGHPNGRRWRQLVCLGCHSYFLETMGTPFHAKQVEPDKLVWAIAALAEGLGIRAVARVFEVDPKTVLGWLVEATEHLERFSRYHLQRLHVEQVQMDELFALLSAVKEGEISEAEAIKRLSRSPHWVWVAMDPVSKLILTVDVGERTLAMTQRLVHQVKRVLAPDCMPLFLTDGCREYLTALVTHYGGWIQPECLQSKGPRSKPRWMPSPQLLYAQVVKSYRRRRVTGVKHRVVFGTRDIIDLQKMNWKCRTGVHQQMSVSLKGLCRPTLIGEYTHADQDTGQYRHC